MGGNRLAAIGAFVIGGLALFAVGLFIIGDRRMLFGGTFAVHAEFADIAGLQRGGIVRVAGMHAGEVELIEVPGSPSGRFRVRMRVRNDLRPLVRSDSVASIQNDGLIGNKYVQIEPGSEQASPFADGDTIRSREPFDFANLLGELEATVRNVNTTVTDVRVELEQALTTLTSAAQTAEDLIEDVGGDAREIVTIGRRISTDLDAIVAGVREGRGTVGRLLNDDALYARATAIAAEAERTMVNVRQATQEARDALAGLRGEEGPVRGLTADVQATLAAARDAMTDLAESTEALKRNFFFRGFFNRRGYFDLQDVTVQEYREGALASGDRRVLRIWIRSDLLFETGPDGSERLSEGGRARLDSAMSQFVRYPKTSPLVVEGYARGDTADERHLASRARARLVLDYLTARFDLDPRYVATMAMGQEAEDSPDGREWDGVALAMFVPASAL